MLKSVETEVKFQNLFYFFNLFYKSFYLGSASEFRPCGRSHLKQRVVVFRIRKYGSFKVGITLRYIHYLHGCKFSAVATTCTSITSLRTGSWLEGGGGTLL